MNIIFRGCKSVFGLFRLGREKIGISNFYNEIMSINNKCIRLMSGG